MAELKREEDFLYAYEETQLKTSDSAIFPLIETPAEETVETQVETETTEVVTRQPNPQHLPDLKKVSPLEKVLGLSLLGVAVVLGFLTMNLGNQMTQVKENTIKLENKNNELSRNIDLLTQEKAELSSAKKVKDAASKKGLTLKEENVRTVK